MSVITSIATAVPKHKHKQSDLADFMSDMYAHGEVDRRKLRMMYANSGIASRYSVIPDYSSSMDQRNFFPETTDLEPFPDVAYRMKYFDENALELAKKVALDCLEGKMLLEAITHLITVSCTGLAAPGLDIEIIQQLKLNKNINRSSVNFMGCYAMLHALKQADYICKAFPDAKVLVVSVELCTIHFQKLNIPDNIVSNLLFGDGAAAALIVSKKHAEKNKLRGFGIQNFYSQVSLDGKGDMAWKLSSTGFLMTLSSYIPQLIEKGVRSLFENALKQLNIQKGEVTHWAIHPGGRKILENIQKELQLTEEDMESSTTVLKEYGNMSSATFLFVLKELMENKIDLSKKENTFGVAFGPGLTMESVIFQNV